jgi:PAS domain S-box-containing protein
MPGNVRVLFVDEGPVRDDRATTLPGTDAEVTALTERSVSAAIERIETDDVGCVVSGYDLPDGTGMDLLEATRERHPSLPFVVFSETGPSSFAERAIDADLTEYLRRDPERDQGEQLAETVRQAIDDAREPASIEKTQERFRTIIEQSTDIVSILDRDGTYIYQSPSIKRIMDYNPEEFVGESAFDYVHPDDRELVMKEFYTTIENPDRQATAEYRFKHADGSWRVVESRGINMLSDPVVGGVVVNSRDVTDRRRREQRMNVLNRTLRHDLRNNMNVVLGNAELLMREYGSDDRAETIRKTAADMLELGNKVRDIERALDSSETPREMVDIVSVVEEHLASVERANPDVDVRTDLPESEWVIANRLIGSAVDDAIENAIEHNRGDGPKIRVRLEHTELAGDDAVRLEIADDGPGIPDEELEVLMAGGETPLEHASGLGLWLIKWIVNESAGEVAFEDNDMGGTTVAITLKKARIGQQIENL